MDSNPQPKVEPDCSKKLKDIGVFAIVASLFLALCIGISVPNLGTHGEIGRFAHDVFAPLVLSMGAWGLATGVGLLRAWRWARISMLVFCSLLAVYGAIAVLVFLLMPNGDISGWPLFLLKAGMMLVHIIPVAIGVRLFIYFRRNNVKAYFQRSRNNSMGSA